MTVVTKAYTFAPATDIKSAEVNENFDRLYNYINSEVIVRDASQAFTVIPSGPGTDPTSSNQFARKAYVDQRVKIDGTTAFTGIPSGPATNPTTENQFTRKKYVDERPTFTGFAVTSGALYAGSTQYGVVPSGSTSPTFAASQFQIKSGTDVFTNSGSITFASPFPNGLISLTTTVANNSAGDILKTNLETKSGFSIQAWKLNAGSWDPSPGSVRISWIAIGW
jgi:hypothetical protein